MIAYLHTPKLNAHVSLNRLGMLLREYTILSA